MKNRACKLAASAISPMLASMVMCFILLSILGSMLKSDVGIVMIQFVQLLIFVIMLYLPFYNWGMENSRAAKSAGVMKDLITGVRAGMLLSVILYISVAFLILMKLGLMPDSIFLYKILNPQFTGILHFLILNNTITEVTLPQMACAAVLPLIVPVVTGLAYYLGGKASDQDSSII